MRSLIYIGLAASVIGPSAAIAEVVASTTSTFEIKQSVTIDKPDTLVWETLRSPQKWWGNAHTYSGDRANLYLDMQATGCLCEKLPGRGSVEHAHVVYVQPQRLLRLRGALGPLHPEAVVGTLTITLDGEGENATHVLLTYLVSGYIKAGADSMAPGVDEMLAAQLVNLKTAAESVAAPTLPE